LTALYEAYSRGAESPLEELPIQYADYAVWQREWLQGEVLEAQMNYWREQLATAPTALELPTDHVRPALQSYRGAAQNLFLPLELSHGLKELSRREGATLFMTLLAAFEVLLYRYSGQEDFCVGTPIANRNRGEIEGLIGFFVNTLVLRADLSGAPSFTDLLAQVRNVALDAYAHQDVPFEQLVEELQPTRALSHSPLFQVVFNLQTPSGQMASFEDLTFSAVEATSHTAKFDLVLSSIDTNAGIALTMEYSTDLFADESIAQLLEHFEKLLQAIVHNPKLQTNSFPLLSETERRQLVVGWNDTASEYPRTACIHELFEAEAARRPQATALLFRDLELSYGELNESANRVAHYLRSLGVRAESRVGICMERSERMLIGLLGILKAGGAYVPLDPQYPAARLHYMLADAHVQVLLTQSALAERFVDEEVQLVSLDADWERIAAESGANPANEVRAENLAYLIYTSGSTGEAKGVAVTHQAVLRLVVNTNYAELDNKSVVLQAAPLSFDASTFEIWGALLRGGKLVLLEGAVPSASQLREVIAGRGVTTAWLTASLFNYVVDEDVHALRGLRQLLVGGEALSVKHIGRALSELDKTELINGYGPTEATTFSCTHLIESVEDRASIPIGQPVANTQAYVLDGRGEPVPVGVAGELYIGGEGLARGYWNRAELTAERFVPDGVSGRYGERLYRSGDLVRRRREGELEYLGRLDQQVKVRGYRIELGEIEQALLQHEHVREAVVVMRAEEHEKRLLGYVVLEAGAAVEPRELREYLGGRLPEYMVPSVLTELTELPLTRNGKVDRRALANAALSEREERYVAPRTATEEMVAGIWANVLKLERVGVKENFFEAGGHSLLATQVVSRLRESFGVELALRELFEHATVAQLAQRVDEALRSGAGVAAPPIVKVARDKALPLSFAQQRLWFLNQLEGGGTAYNIPSAVRLAGKLNSEALLRSLDEIVRRHEVLRTHFGEVDGQAVQLVSATAQAIAEVIDLAELAGPEQEAEVRRLAIAEAETPFDLSRGPLLRVKLLRLRGVDSSASSERDTGGVATEGHPYNE
jgi:amino acid adenylation domain-containing protein